MRVNQEQRGEGADVQGIGQCQRGGFEKEMRSLWLENAT